MIDLIKTKEDLKKHQKRYEKVCDKLEQLNEEAFFLEQEMTIETAVLEKNKKISVCPFCGSKDTYETSQGSGLRCNGCGGYI